MVGQAKEEFVAHFEWIWKDPHEEQRIDDQKEIRISPRHIEENENKE